MTADVVRSGRLERVFHRAWSALGKNAFRGLLALTDQAVVSGTNFCATILVGRAASQADLGLYAAGFTIVVLVLVVQQSLICLPFTVYSPRLDDDGQRRLLGSSILQSGVIGGATAFVLAVGALVTWLIDPTSRFILLLAVLALSLPFLLLRELARRSEFARLRIEHALALDVFLAILQITGLLALRSDGRLNAVTAHACLGLTSAAAAGLWFFASRTRIAFRAAQVADDIKRHWNFGRWVLAGSLVSMLNVYLLHWVLLFRLGADATGALAACATIVDLSNPFMIGISNLLGPRAAHAFHHGGAAALRNIVGWATAFIGGTMALFLAAVACFGGYAAGLIFGPEYAHFGPIITILATGTWAAALATAAGDGLCVMERPRFNLLAGTAGLLVAATTSLLLLGPFEVVGAAAAILAGQSVGSVLRMAFFYGSTRAAVQEGARA